MQLRQEASVGPSQVTQAALQLLQLLFQAFWYWVLVQLVSHEEFEPW